MFLHIATDNNNLKEVLKTYELKTGLDTSQYEICKYNLSDLYEESLHNAKSAIDIYKNMINDVTFGRRVNNLCVIQFEHMRQFEDYTDCRDILKNNCLFIIAGDS